MFIFKYKKLKYFDKMLQTQNQIGGSRGVRTATNQH